MRDGKVYLLFLMLVVFSHCTSYESILNYNAGPELANQPTKIINYKSLTIRSGDLLYLSISSLDAQALAPFVGTENEGGQSQNYLVDDAGYIIFPTIGKVRVAQLSIPAAKESILRKLRPYFQNDPILNMRLANFKINVHGEIRSPGNYSVESDRLSILEAITQAGDFTDFSRRDSILIIRETEGYREFGYVNFNSTEIFESPYYYLQQNDMIYVQPTKNKLVSIRDPSTRYIPWVTSIVSVTAILFSIFNRRR